MKITKRQLRRIIKETIAQGETITMARGDSFPHRTRAPNSASSQPGPFKDTIVMSPNADSVLVGGEETDMSMLDIRLYELSGVILPTELEDDLRIMATKQMADGYVEIPISWSPNTGWRF